MSKVQFVSVAESGLMYVGNVTEDVVAIGEQVPGIVIELMFWKGTGYSTWLKYQGDHGPHAIFLYERQIKARFDVVEYDEPTVNLPSGYRKA